MSFKIEEKFHCDAWFFMQPQWYSVWKCRSFPAKSWNELTDRERADLLFALPLSTTDVRPLQLGELIFLTRVFDRFKDMAEKARAELEETTPGQKPPREVYPVLEIKNSPLVYILLQLDFSKTRQRLLREIDLWLRLPENKARFVTHKRFPMGINYPAPPISGNPAAITHEKPAALSLPAMISQISLTV